MKIVMKSMCFAAFAALALVSGCSKEESGQNGGGNGRREADANSLEVIARDILKSGDTKTYLTADAGIAWSDKDTIRVIGKNNAGADMLVVPLGTDATHGFLSEGDDGPLPAPATGGVAYTALYPASMFAGATATSIDGALPTEYTYSAYALNPLRSFPMYAQSTAKDSKVLRFRSAFGLLRMNVRGTMSVTKIEVSSKNDNLAGAFSINPETGAITFTGMEKTVTIDCGPGGVALNGNNGVQFFLPLVPGTYDDIKVKIYTKEMDKSGGSCEHVSTDVEIKCCTIHQSTFVAERDAVQLWPGGPYWATANVGASSPTDYGEYFAWGEIVGHIWDGAEWSNFPTTKPDDPRYSNNNWNGSACFSSDYCNTPYYNSSSSSWDKYTASGSVLELMDDAAYINWGGDWGMPTAWDIKDLFTRCDTTWTGDYEGTGVAGMLFTNKLDTTRKVFFPAAGKGVNLSVSDETTGNYWSMTLKEGETSFCLTFDSGNVDACKIAERYIGMPVRPIKGGGRATGVTVTTVDGLTFDSPLSDGATY